MQTLADTTETPQSQPATEAPVVLRAKGLRKSFGGQVVLDGVDLELRRGEVILLEGENGSGKTTLLNILTGNLEPNAGTIHYSADQSETEFTFPQRWWQSFNLAHRFAPDTIARLGFGRTWQDVRLFDSMSLQDNIAIGQQGQRGENPLVALVSCRDDNATAPDTMLARLGLAGRENSSADKISLGQSKRVAIARAIAAGARVLFLDEPLAGLDRNGINDVLGMLSELVEKHEITLVVIEHAFNQTHLRDLITSHWHLAEGQLTTGPADRINTQPVSATPHWFQMLTEAAEEVITEQLPRGATLTRFRIASRFKPNPTLSIEDLIVKRGNRTVIGLDDEGNETGFNLTINEGEIAVLQAPNGWGKTSLCHAIAGLTPRCLGTTSLNGFNLDTLPCWQRVGRGLRANTSDHKLFPSLTVAEVSKLASISESVSAQGHAIVPSHMTSSLSGGEHQSLSLDSLLCSDGPLCFLILDEGFSALDIGSCRDLTEVLLKAEMPTLLVQPCMRTNPENELK